MKKKKPFPSAFKETGSAADIYWKLKSIKYSCFENGCLTNEESLRDNDESYYNGQWWFYGCWIQVQGVTTRWKKTAQTQVFMLSPSFLLNHLAPQSSNAKLLLPITPIDIFAYAITLL